MGVLQEDKTMGEIDRNELHLKDAEIASADVTDEALENAGDIGQAKAAAWTVVACTGVYCDVGERPSPSAMEIIAEVPHEAVEQFSRLPARGVRLLEFGASAS
jgi:hypothetical protein